VAGANWLSGAAPLDTAAPTTLPAFLLRRRTVLEIGLPLLAALVLAAVLFQVRRGSGPRSAAAPVAEVIPIQHLDTSPPPAPQVAAPQAPSPAPEAPAVAPVPTPSLQPASLQPAPVRPVTPVRPPAPPERHPPRPSASQRRRPSLKQIGIEQ
jgi:hypothetical protein